jgi:drug/metabolite transporter (DMT)-like permease
MELLFSLVAAICLGLHNAIAKKPLQTMSPSLLFFWRELVLVLLMLPVLIYFKPEIDFQNIIIQKNFGISILAGFIGFFVVVFLYKGIQVGNPGLIGAISNSYLPGVMILSYIFLDEVLELAFIPKAALIFMGILLISLPKGLKEKKNTKGIHYAIFAMIIYSVMFILYKPATIVLGAILASFVMRFSGFLTVIFALKLQGKKFVFPRKELGLVILLGFLMTITIFALGFALENSGKNLSAVVAIVGSSPLITIIYSHFVYKMSITPKQLIGVFATIVGIILLSL